jgi:hypothetical protein
MAAWQHLKFDNVHDMINYLNGEVVAPNDISGGLLVDGLTLVINVGGLGDRTVTFAPAKSRAWNPAEIRAAVEAAHADLTDIPEYWNSPRQGNTDTATYLKLVSPTAEVVVVKSTGSANTLFGFSAVLDTTGVPVIVDDVWSINPPTDTAYGWSVVLFR